RTRPPGCVSQPQKRRPPEPSIFAWPLAGGGGPAFSSRVTINREEPADPNRCRPPASWPVLRMRNTVPWIFRDMRETYCSLAGTRHMVQCPWLCECRQVCLPEEGKELGHPVRSIRVDIDQ